MVISGCEIPIGFARWSSVWHCVSLVWYLAWFCYWYSYSVHSLHGRGVWYYCRTRPCIPMQITYRSKPFKTTVFKHLLLIMIQMETGNILERQNTKWGDQTQTHFKSYWAGSDCSVHRMDNNRIPKQAQHWHGVQKKWKEKAQKTKKVMEWHTIRGSATYRHDIGRLWRGRR